MQPKRVDDRVVWAPDASQWVQAEMRVPPLRAFGAPVGMTTYRVRAYEVSNKRRFSWERHDQVEHTQCKSPW